MIRERMNGKEYKSALARKYRQENKRHLSALGRKWG